MKPTTFERELEVYNTKEKGIAFGKDVVMCRHDDVLKAKNKDDKERNKLVNEMIDSYTKKLQKYIKAKKEILEEIGNNIDLEINVKGRTRKHYFNYGLEKAKKIIEERL